MNDKKALNTRYETIAWGAIFILLSILLIIPSDQNNWFILGIGIIFLGLNLVRYLNGMVVNSFSTTIGGLFLILGIASLLRTALGIGIHLEMDIFALAALVLGLYLLIPSPKKMPESG